MDLTSSTTTTYTIGTDTQTPPPTQPTKTTNTSKSLSFTNGTHNKHHHHPTTTTPPPSQPPPSMVVYSYKECLKNHAASIGGHALDGCGEFMPSSSTNPTDPRSLKCAACGCHRNFHRRDPQEPPHSNHNHNHNHNNNPTFLTCFYSTTPSSVTPTAPPPQPPPPPPLPHRGMSQSTSPSLSSSPSHSPSPMSSSPSSPPPLSHLPPSSYHTSSAPHMLLALGNNAYSVDHEHHHHQHHRNFNSSSVVMMKTHENNNNNNNNNNNSSGKKRYRTKFSQEQKEKMYSFSEKLGWRMQKGDDGLVQEFCNDIGVPRGVFKVWMHNNKNTLRNKRSEVIGNNAPQTDERTHGIEDGNDGRGDDGAFVGSDINNPFNTNGGNNDIQRNDDSCVNVHVSINGLSS